MGGLNLAHVPYWRASKKILPWRSRILGLEAFQETCLHRTHFPASFLWWGMACRAWAGQRRKKGLGPKRLLQRAWLQEHGSWLPVARGALYRASAAHKQGTRQKILPRRNRILGKWLFRRLAVGNTSKTLGFRNVLWESGLRKNFLKVLCPSRNLRESGSFGKVS